MKRTNIFVGLIVIVFILCAVSSAVASPRWNASIMTKTGGSTPALTVSYEIAEWPNSEWVWWADVFTDTAPVNEIGEKFGAGVSCEYTEMDIPLFDAVGAGAYHADNDWHGMIYTKVRVGSW